MKLSTTICDIFSYDVHNRAHLTKFKLSINSLARWETLDIFPPFSPTQFSCPDQLQDLYSEYYNSLCRDIYPPLSPYLLDNIM